MRALQGGYRLSIVGFPTGSNSNRQSIPPGKVSANLSLGNVPYMSGPG